MDPNEIDKMEHLGETHWWFQGKKYILNNIMRMIDCVGGRYLDIGCGTGMFLRELGEGMQLSGVDISERALSYCKKKVNAELALAQGRTLPFNKDTFSLVTLLDMLEHVDEDFEVLKEAYRVCLPGAVVIITVPAFGFLWGSHDVVHHHKRRYTRKQLRDLALSAGFRIERLTYTNIFIFIPALLRRMISRNSPDKRSDLRPTPYILNEFLKCLYKLEACLLKMTNFPFGVSLLMVLRKPII